MTGKSADIASLMVWVDQKRAEPLQGIAINSTVYKFSQQHLIVYRVERFLGIDKDSCSYKTLVNDFNLSISNTVFEK